MEGPWVGVAFAIIVDIKQKGLRSSTPECQSDIPDVARMPDPQEYQTPSKFSGRKR
jgi:hypothetical protein